MGAAEEGAGGDEARSFKKAWPQQFDADPLAKFSRSRFGLLRAFGEARGTVLETQLMQPVPPWVFVLCMTEALWCFIVFFALAGLAMHPSTRSNANLLLMFLMMQIVTGIAWWTICFSYRRCLTEPDAGLTLLPRQAVFRGCLVERAPWHGGGSAAPGWEAAPGAPHAEGMFRTVSALFARRPTPLQDFTVRNHAYTVRLLLQALIMLVCGGTGVLLHALHATDETLFYARVALHGLNVFVYVETIISFTFGIHMTVCWWIGNKVAAHTAKKRGGTSAKPAFVPFDPRATVVQNICFAICMAPPAVALLAIYSEEGANSRCPSIWIASTSSAIQMGLVLTTGASYSFCPFTFGVGLLVWAGIIPRPLPRGTITSDKVLMLTYGIWGPVVSLSDESPGDVLPKLGGEAGGGGGGSGGGGRGGGGGGGGGGDGAEPTACEPKGVRPTNFLSVVPC